ncbi:MAG: DMT family transporter [Muribaculaceae bacterium]|nr:DMT family transporter [Muribaculaceae bacterium]
MLLTMVLFGLMSPFSKDAMNSGLTGPQLATLRICGGTLLFWLSSLFLPWHHVSRRDLLRLAVASIFGVVLSQGGLIMGISRTSPINATMEITAQPIYVLVLAAIILHERITPRKAAGVLLGFAGAATLVLMNTGKGGPQASIVGDLMVLGSQVAFALYLTMFLPLIRRLDPLTFNRWMFTFGSLLLLPFTAADMAQLDWSAVSARIWAEVAYIIVCCTFICFLLVVYSQRRLPSTVVSSYNYIQPVVTVVASLMMGLAVLQWQHVLAAALIFTGVWLVIHARKAT